MHIRFPTISRRLSIGLCTVFFSGACLAQSFPDKPVSLIVPFPPGAATDTIARTLADKLTEKWGQPVVVENRAGATGSIGSNYVARSKPDGYTMLVGTTSSHTMGPNLFKNKTWDPIKDFTPITLLAWAPNVLEVNPSVPAKSVPELIALLKKDPGKYTYASSGTGSSIHLAGELFQSLAGVEMTHIPYKGASPAVMDLLGGQVDIMFDTVALSLPHIKAGKLRALAVTTTQRSSSLPDIPTMQQAGLKDYEMAAWIGLLAPAGTPEDVIAKIETDVQAILQTPDVKKRLFDLGTDVSGMSSAEFSELVAKELPRYGEIMRKAGIEPGN
ncbi:tripartite tricarboxylate transporter substrate binding protein [Pusillimonas sp. SM2304]|uniref:Bug family tripartite tricarboxylate transporter substrate binding protein n=1 Tax=Pusillimonas sp. SM2304 TaxID=3073241 RepID=UPI0028756958|nr:tripartite tricarboxylate transporter substrate binding protein [Pusillimonas sp. SM2304]MDS1138890.1 tripartite tricarboxylate transporter substrate binding protein [Pusillimonas sp. SM2304]